MFAVLGNAQASPLTPNELKSISEKLTLASDFQELSCEETNAEIQNKVFLFDGDMGFCPLYFMMNRPRFTRESNGESFLERLNETVVTSENNDAITQIKKALHDEDLMRNCLLVKTVLEKLHDSIRARQPELFYYSKKGEDEAFQCLTQVLKNAKSKPSIRAVAYSMGSVATLHFAESFSILNQKLDHVVTVDPVGRGLEWYTGVIYTRDNPLFKKVSTVNEWSNFFQKQDQYSLLHNDPIHLGIRGSRVIDADSNLEITADQFHSEQDRRRGHVHILSQDAVLTAIESVL